MIPFENPAVHTLFLLLLFLSKYFFAGAQNVVQERITNMCKRKGVLKIYVDKDKSYS